MLTPEQIRSNRFPSSVRGSYKSDDVDDYFEEVIASYEQAFKENAELIKKITLLAERVEAYRVDEDNIKETLLTAQRMSDKMLREANETSENQLKAASEKLEYAEEYSKSQAQLIIDDANKKSQEELFEAEKKAELIVGDAERKVKLLIDDAEKQAEEILMSAKRDSLEQLEKTKKQLDAEILSFELLKKEAAEFKGELLEKYRQHIEFIGSMLGAGDPSTPNSDNQESPFFEETSAVAVAFTPDDVEAVEAEEPAAEEQDETDDQDEPDSYLESEIDDIPDENDEELEAEADENEEEDEIEDVDDTDEDAASEVVVDLNEEKTANESNDEDFNSTFSQSSDPLSFFRFSPEKAESEGGFPGLFTLKQTAMAQTQENSGADNVAVLDDLGIDTDAPIEFTFNSADDASTEIEEKISEETAEPSVSDENGGFKVFLDNLDEEEVLPEESQEDLVANTEKFITVEYDEDDDDDDEDDEQQPKFKGFFRK